MELKLFSDRISHPCRACLLLLRSLERPFDEVKLNLLRGHHFKREELKPWLKVPVLQVQQHKQYQFFVSKFEQNIPNMSFLTLNMVDQNNTVFAPLQIPKLFKRTKFGRAVLRMSWARAETSFGGPLN